MCSINPHRAQIELWFFTIFKCINIENLIYLCLLFIQLNSNALLNRQVRSISSLVHSIYFYPVSSVFQWHRSYEQLYMTFSKIPIDYNPFSFNSLLKCVVFQAQLTLFFTLNYSDVRFNLCSTSSMNERTKMTECIRPPDIPCIVLLANWFNFGMNLIKLDSKLS